MATCPNNESDPSSCRTRLGKDQIEASRATGRVGHHKALCLNRWSPASYKPKLSGCNWRGCWPVAVLLGTSVYADSFASSCERHLERKDSELKESVIAIEVFGRKPGYDPKQDSIVRSEAARLRSRRSSSTGPGQSDAIVIELPKGGYIPVFRIADANLPPRRRIWSRLRSQRFW